MITLLSKTEMSIENIYFLYMKLHTLEMTNQEKRKFRTMLLILIGFSSFIVLAQYIKQSNF